VRIILHSSGHFVVLRFLQRFRWPQTKFIFDAIEHNMQEIGTGAPRLTSRMLATPLTRPALHRPPRSADR
jgi:hypothetical protein